LLLSVRKPCRDRAGSWEPSLKSEEIMPARRPIARAGADCGVLSGGVEFQGRRAGGGPLRRCYRRRMSRSAKANGTNGLAAAMTLLIQNQAAFVSHMRRCEEEFARISRRFDDIEAILLRHERILVELPEIIRQKVGFKAT
jgi:hypothetical protein